MEIRTAFFFLTTLFSLSTSTNARDLPCAAQQIPGRSVVCVCNVTYCDTITRIPPPPGSFVTYTSSEGGLRFDKTIGKLQSHLESDLCIGPTFTLNPSVRYQSVEGFGSSVTDAAGIMWSSIPARLQKKLIDSYYADDGLEYNMIRVPIGGTDFSTRPYAYNEYPPYDVKLSNFSLAMEDYRYKIPVIKAIMKASPHKVHIIASTWSPPSWMKTNNAFIGYSRLIPDYYQTYADYHLKFLEGYAAEGVPIWAITTGNEPSDGMAGLIPLNCLGWNADSMASWIIHNLGPTIRQSPFKDVKILCADDQRPMLPYWVTLMFGGHPKVMDYVDGIAVHYYFDGVVPPTVLSQLAEQYPEKFIIGTEATVVPVPGSGPAVNFGHWERARLYVTDIINVVRVLKRGGKIMVDCIIKLDTGKTNGQLDLTSRMYANAQKDINHSVVGWIDWNMCLNKDGGPNWNGNDVDAPVIVLPELGQFVKQPMYYGIGHFSKFVPRGSRRIHVSQNQEGLSMLSVAFLTPQNTIVVVLYNQLPSSANIVLGGRQASIQLDRNSVTTIELPYK